MLTRLFKIKRKYRNIGAAVLFGIICLFLVLIFHKGTTPTTGSLMVPVGQTTFSISLDIDEDESYAGIEFALTISDESALTFESFTPGPGGATASPFMAKDGLHYFGYYSLTGSNFFSAGEALAGTLDFTGYTGIQEMTIAVVQMKVIRVDEYNKSVTTEKESPSYVFTVQRKTDG